MRRLTTPFLGAAALVGLVGRVARGEPGLRVATDQHGDFLLIGNTIGYDCAGENQPIVGDVGTNACNQAGKDDSAPDLFWRSFDTAADKPLATKWLPSEARSTAVLTVPTGARVTHAFLYWAATNVNSTPGASVLLERPGAALSQTITASQSFVSTANTFQSVADITPIVQEYGSGAYRVGGLSVLSFIDRDANVAFGGWTMVAFYELGSEPMRNLALFDGLDVMDVSSEQSLHLNGFLVPNAGFDAKLGVIAYEGDASSTGDRLFFNDVELSNALNPADNFFNSTRSWLGQRENHIGDYPQLTGASGSMAGMDLDVVDVHAMLHSGDRSATLRISAGFDEVYLGAFVTSIGTFRPNFGSSSKTVQDINGGAVLPGDVLKYTITIANTGNDGSVETVLSDPLSPALTYVPNSLTIESGANAGAKTDAAGDDQAEYLPSERRVVVRLGTGATATAGGALIQNAASTVSFRVTVNASALGTVANQAVISAGGQIGAPVSVTVTGNGVTPGIPTNVTVDQCQANAECRGGTPVCNTTASPKVCVGCMADSDCGGLTSGRVCAQDHTCIHGCRGLGGNGCQAGLVCTSTTTGIGYCFECVQDSDCGGPTSGRICDIEHNRCADGCRGAAGNGCQSGSVCTSVDTHAGACVECSSDADCGATASGRVCDPTNHACRDGCRGVGGNRCASGVECTSVDASIGACVLDGGDAGDASDASDASPDIEPIVEAAVPDSAPPVVEVPDVVVPPPDNRGAGGANPWDDVVAQGNGVSCSAASSGLGLGHGAAWLLGALGLAGGVLQRRRRSRSRG